MANTVVLLQKKSMLVANSWWVYERLIYYHDRCQNTFGKVIVLSSRDELLIRSGSWIFQNFSFVDSWSLTLDPRFLILAFQNLTVVTFATWELSFEDQVETVNLHLSITVAEEFTWNGFQMIVAKSMPKEFVILTNHNRSRQCDEPIWIPRNYQ